MIQPKQVKTIARALGSCKYGDKPVAEQLAFVIGYLAGSAAAAGQVENTKKLTDWSVRRFKESEALLKFIKKEGEIVDKQARVTEQN